jgi:hypothetical protein
MTYGKSQSIESDAILCQRLSGVWLISPQQWRQDAEVGRGSLTVGEVPIVDEWHIELLGEVDSGFWIIWY